MSIAPSPSSQSSPTPPTSAPIAFRCTTCWQLTRADSDESGNTLPCLCCASPVVVPEPNDDNLAAGANFLQQVNPLSSRIDLEEQLDSKEIASRAEELYRQKLLAEGSIHLLTAPRGKRFIAAMIDSGANFVSVVLGFVLAWLISPGGEPDIVSFMVLMAVPLGFTIYQAYLTSVQGQTVGKICLCTRIVDANGYPPGFVRGVLVRNTLVAMLGVIPFFSLVNLLWIFGEDTRCLHDLIAGTYVIDD